MNEAAPLKLDERGEHNPLDVRLGIQRLGDGPDHLWTRQAGGSMSQRRLTRSPSGVFYAAGTAPEVMAALDGQIELEGLGGRGKARVFLGDPESGLDWMQDFDVAGLVASGPGDRLPARVALLLVPSGHGDHERVELRTANIVRLVIGRKTVYQHPLYHQPAIERRPAGDVGRPHGVYLGGAEHCEKSFASEIARDAWVKFVQGDRASPRLSRLEQEVADQEVAARESAAREARGHAAGTPAGEAGKPAAKRGPGQGL